MKIVLTYRFWFVFCSLIVCFNFKTYGQHELDRSVKLPKMKGTVYAALGKISEVSGYLFIYDSGIVNNDSIVKVKAGERSLKQAIEDVIGDKGLDFRLVGSHILITQKQKDLSKQPLKKEPETTFPVVYGVLLDSQTGEAVTNASVFLKGSSIGNITNQSGEFKLNLPDSVQNSTVVFSHIGYVTQEISIQTLLGRHNVLSLIPKIIPLQEVFIRVVDPKRLIREMLDRKKDNYFNEPIYLSTFYREGVQLKNKFQQLTEGVFKIYKPTTSDLNQSDQVKLLKMSRLNNIDVKDSVAVKISAGIEACLQLDIIKYLPEFLSLDMNPEWYDYTSGGISYIDNRCVNVVCFEQKKSVKDPLFCGELYIDSENSALIQARIEMQPKYIRKAANIFIVKQKGDIRLVPQKAVYTISYRPWNGLYYVYHVRGDLEFRTKRKKFLATSSTLSTWFEMVTCKVENEQVVPFSKIDRLPTRTILSELNFKYDETFWQDFNVIPLEDKLSKIIEKVTLKIDKIGD